MLASIIIPTFNRVDLLTQRSLESALTQNFEDYEVIVVDDCSTDKTEEVVKRWMKRYPNLRYYKMPQNSGLSAVRNKGFSLAKGKFVVCLDDDNELLPNFLMVTTNILRVSPPKIGAIGIGKIIKYVKQNFEDYAPPPTSQKIISMDWGWLFKKEVFDNLQYDEALRANDDTDFGIQYLKKYSYLAIDSPLGIAFDIEDEKKSLSFPDAREIAGMRLFLKKNEHEYTDPNEKRYLYRLMGRKLYRGGHKREGLGFFWKSFNGMADI